MLKFVAFVICVAIFDISVAKHLASAGVWVDDGHGYTVKAELPAQEAKILKRHMLDLFGLPNRPRHGRHHLPRINSSAPAFLKSIYDALDERGHAPHLDSEHRATVDAADVIITFVNKNFPLHHLPQSHRRLMFKMDDVPLSDALIGAELRVYREANERIAGEELALHIYLGAENKEDEKVIAKAILPEKGWTSFNITKAVLSWIVFPDSNHGLRLAVTRSSYKHELHLTEVGVVGGHDQEEFRPFIVGFFAQPDHKKNVFRSRTIRSAMPKSEYKKNPFTTDHKKNVYRSRTIRSAMPKSEYKKNPFTTEILEQETPPDSHCQKRPLHVSFVDLGWQDWVIAPTGYDANFCNGRCQFPLLAGMNVTNHAIIQTLVKMKKAYNEDAKPPPEACCAPRELTTISVLYYDYLENVVLKKYPKMIVKTCGCI